MNIHTESKVAILNEGIDLASNGCSQFEQLGALFSAIHQALGDTNNLQAKNLAELGQYLCDDWWNTYSIYHEAFTQAIEEVGE